MSADNPRKFKVRLWHILFLTVLVCCTVALAWWQWTRFRSGSGTFQNLGYALQWPFFGAFFVYAYRRFVQYENERFKSDDEIYEAPNKTSGMTEIDPDFLPQRQQLSVAEFNELNVQRRGHANSGIEPGTQRDRQSDAQLGDAQSKQPSAQPQNQPGTPRDE